MNLRLSQFVPESLDCVLFLLHLRTAVLQLRLQELGSLFVVGHPVVGFDLRITQLIVLYRQSLKDRKMSCQHLQIDRFQDSVCGNKSKYTTMYMIRRKNFNKKTKQTKRYGRHTLTFSSVCWS